MRPPPTCRGCGEWLERGEYVRLCPSCRFVGRWAFAVGALLAGALVKWLG
jgi:hypothetical protein